MGGRPAPLLESFAAWLSAFGDAWEHADPDEMAALMALGATFQPTPFDDLLRGRPAIREHWRAQFTALRGVQFRAQVLGAGDTYGVAHWRVSFTSGERSTESVRDGVLLAALDGRRLCTSLRAWWHEAIGEQSRRPADA
jgi:ketosteroid isomerase-like protein